GGSDGTTRVGADRHRLSDVAPCVVICRGKLCRTLVGDPRNPAVEARLVDGCRRAKAADVIILLGIVDDITDLSGSRISVFGDVALSTDLIAQVIFAVVGIA